MVKRELKAFRGPSAEKSGLDIMNKAEKISVEVPKILKYILLQATTSKILVEIFFRSESIKNVQFFGYKTSWTKISISLNYKCNQLNALILELYLLHLTINFSKSAENALVWKIVPRIALHEEDVSILVSIRIKKVNFGW